MASDTADGLLPVSALACSWWCQHTSLERLAGAVMCDQDEAWSDARYFSEKVMAELHAEGRPTGTGERPSEEQLEGFRLVAKEATDASLELADELEAA